MQVRTPRLLVQLDPAHWRVVEVDDVFLVEAVAEGTRVRLRSAEALVDYRRFGEVFAELEPVGIVRIHRSYAVHPGRILELRLRDGGIDWELRLEPPVNRVLPVARERRDAVVEAIRHLHES